ncbi:MAG TPA: DinB family protein [Gemmataceae bacterium]|nr:DinB family protein [Gemmataceae bacterium]
MKASEAIQAALSSTQQLLNWYIADLSDADLLVRPAPGANHIAWQLGHVIAGEVLLVAPQLPDAPYPALSPGFKDQYDKHGAADDSPMHFLSKEQYVEQFTEVREVTKTAVAKLSDADLDRPTTGDMAKFAPKLGDLLILVSNHTLMHAGQFTVVRRKLGKPIVF